MPLSGTPRPRGAGQQAEGRVDDPMSGRTEDGQDGRQRAGRAIVGLAGRWSQDVVAGRRTWTQDGAGVQWSGQACRRLGAGCGRRSSAGIGCVCR